MTVVELNMARNKFQVEISKVPQEALLKSWLDEGWRIFPCHWKDHVSSDEITSKWKSDKVCDLISKASKEAEGLIELGIDSVPISPSMVDLITQQLQHPNSRTLKVLSILDFLDGYGAGERRLLAFLQEIAGDPSIQLEVLSYRKSYSKRRLPVLLSALPHQRNLRRLEICGVFLDKGLLDLLIRTVIYNSSTLVFLNLMDCTFDIGKADRFYECLAELANRKRLNLKVLKFLGCEAENQTVWRKFVSNPRFQIRSLQIPEIQVDNLDHVDTVFDNFHVQKLTIGMFCYHFGRNRWLLEFMHRKAVEAFHVARALDVLNESGKQNPKILILPNEIMERILYFVPEMPILSNEQIQKIHWFAKNGSQIKDMGSTKVDPDFLDSVACRDLAPFDFTETFKIWARSRFEAE